MRHEGEGLEEEGCCAGVDAWSRSSVGVFGCGRSWRGGRRKQTSDGGGEEQEGDAEGRGRGELRVWDGEALGGGRKRDGQGRCCCPRPSPRCQLSCARDAYAAVSCCATHMTSLALAVGMPRCAVLLVNVTGSLLLEGCCRVLREDAAVQALLGEVVEEELTDEVQGNDTANHAAVIRSRPPLSHCG
eukprot:12317-Rhodomonas_salina.1